MTPRLLTLEQAAAYCGVSPAHFTETIGKEVAPVKVRAAVRWDRVALDAWIDQESGLYNGGERQRSIAERVNRKCGSPASSSTVAATPSFTLIIV